MSDNRFGIAGRAHKDNARAKQVMNRREADRKQYLESMENAWESYVDAYAEKGHW